MPIATTAQMKEIDAYAIRQLGVPSLQLMERAATAVTAQALALPAPGGARRAVVLCGPGNNGGDGIAAARLLAAAGVDVTAFLVGDAARMTADARAMAQRLTAAGGRLLPYSADALAAALAGGAAPVDGAAGPGVDAAAAPAGKAAATDAPGPHAADRPAVCVVDALFGVGLSRPLAGDALAAVEAVNASGLPVVSCDIPSGLDGDSGAVLGAAIRAAVTVTFSCLKPGLLQDQGPAHTGRLVVADIGLPARAVSAVLSPLRFHYFADVQRCLTDPVYQALLGDIQAAGVDNLWLFYYSSGRTIATPQQMAAAKAYLEGRGFTVGALLCAVGHPGQALDPDQPADANALPPHWQYRIGRDGQPVLHCGCIDEPLTADCLAALRTLQELGFDRVFFDDDLRTGHFSPRTEGCFCPACRAAFAAEVGQRYTVAQLDAALDVDADLTTAWQRFQCGRVARFVDRVTATGLKVGIMLMPMGDGRHGLDAAALTAAHPALWVRVGEYHYSDETFAGEEDRRELQSYIRKHLALLARPENAFSETTAYPADALSADNLLEKLRIEIDEGLTNIFLMSGTQPMPRAHFRRLAAALPALRQRALQRWTQKG